jgi:endonuclease/exonuclease/phosphatase family metal-dependent hydrolase
VVLTWNVAGRVRDILRRQIEALAAHRFDVVCLQEITPSTRAEWVTALAAAGFHVTVSEWVAPPAGSRRLAVLIASRSPLEVVPVAGLPWPERHLAVRTRLAGAAVEVHTVHAPLSQKADRVKVKTLEALFAAVTVPDGMPRVVAGDLNTPRYESRDGKITTFARTSSGRLRPDYGERHDRAELALIAELPARGWHDAFRALHGYQRRDRSLMMGRRAYGYRLDHILVSPGLEPLACDYVHEWRAAGLSDHSALWARLGP